MPSIVVPCTRGRPVCKAREVEDRVDLERRRDSVRRSYDAVSAEYAARLGDELDRKPLDRALLHSVIEVAGWSDTTGAAGSGRRPAEGAPPLAVADLGCGPGHVTAWLAGHGAAAVGIDLSPAMIDVAKERCSAGGVARSARPEFRVGDLVELPAADGEFGAVVAFYSIIHLTRHELPAAFGEMRRVLAPGGTALVAFHVGREVRHSDEWWGCEVDVDFHFFEVAEVERAMADSGLSVTAALERRNYPYEVGTRRAYLLAEAPT